MRKRLVSVVMVVLSLGSVGFMWEGGTGDSPAEIVSPAGGYCSREFLVRHWNAQSLGEQFYEGIVEDASQVCLCESRGDPKAVRVDQWENSVGLFQINTRIWKEYRNLDLKDPSVNTATAVEIYKRWGGWGMWSCSCAIKTDIPNQIPYE